MTRAYMPLRPHVWATLAILSALSAAGCRAIDFYEPSAERPVSPAMIPPREKDKMSLPAYQIEPPDVLQIETLKQVPLPPYRAEVYDVLQIRVMGTLPEFPVDGYYLVEAEGIVNLGPAYGSVRVAGMTMDDAKAAIRKQLLLVLKEPEVSVQLARSSGTQPVTGQYLVGPDGMINLKLYGMVHVAGKTIAEAKVAIEKHLAQFFDSPEVSVDVIAYNSKVFYVITEGANLGDNVARVPITGNETVLDAISTVGGLSQLSSSEIWIARPAPGGFNCEQILPVDWDGITKGALSATNYQLMPGDRVYIAEDKIVATNNMLSKIIAPVERLLGVTSLGASTVRGAQTLGRAYNLNRRF